VLSVCLFMTAATGFAGSETIIRERAKELRNQNNVRQGVAPPATPAPVQGSSSVAAPVQSQAVARLQAELAAIQPNSTVTSTQKLRLAQDVVAVAQGTKPSLATAQKWAEDVSTALAEKQLSPANRARFVQELDAVLNPGKYPQAKPEGIYADIQAIFQENGLARAKAVTIANHVRAMATEARR
jgi:hypothetical protein